MTRPVPLILNIDDNDAGRYAVSRALRQAGFAVIEAAAGLTGMEAARAHLPDLILLDVRLPDIDGFEVCRRIREDPRIAGIAVIHMSASYLDTSSRIRGLELGADAYLTEPVEPAVLVATTKSLLRLKQAENQVRESARQWQSTFDALSEGIALLGEEGSAVRSNAAWMKNAGPEASPQRRMIAELFGVVVETRKRECAECVLDDASYSISVDPLTGDAGERTGAVCVMVDTTEKRRFEQQMQQTARLESIGVLAGGIAHDFNNLLTGILGNSSLMLETIAEDAPEREMLNEVVRASESAADLTRQILAYAGKGRFLMRPLDLSEVARQSLALVQRFLSRKVTVVNTGATGLPAVDADSSQMQQLMMNLIINAAESVGEKSAVTVRVSTGSEVLGSEFFLPGEPSQPGLFVTLTVSDDGSGMDETTQNRIFDPFFTTKFAGRGLGLSAVHGILRGHRAVLRLQSKPGVGTTFRLYFPASERQGLARQAARTFGHSAGEGTILVVDDESAVRGMARATLEKRGYQVLVAENGAEGVDLFRRHRDLIRLVLLDFTMPIMDGEETFRQLKLISARIPVILSSGYSRDVVVERFQRDNLAGFLGKPFTSAQLADAVGSALKGL